MNGYGRPALRRHCPMFIPTLNPVGLKVAFSTVTDLASIPYARGVPASVIYPDGRCAGTAPPANAPDVRVIIHHDEIPFPPVQDEVAFIVVFTR